MLGGNRWDPLVVAGIPVVSRGVHCLYWCGGLLLVAALRDMIPACVPCAGDYEGHVVVWNLRSGERRVQMRLPQAQGPKQARNSIYKLAFLQGGLKGCGW